MADPTRPGRTRSRLDGRLVLGGLLVAGVAAIVLAMLAGSAAEFLELIARPPTVIRAFLSGLCIVLGGWLLLGAIRRIGGSIDEHPVDGAAVSASDLGVLVRGVRLVFLSAASFTAAAAWLIGDPLPLVIALVIAGVDIVETSFLLLVASRRSG